LKTREMNFAGFWEDKTNRGKILPN
jgi:hypothetical protein